MIWWANARYIHWIKYDLHQYRPYQPTPARAVVFSRVRSRNSSRKVYLRFPWKATSESTTVRSLFSSGLGWLLIRAIFLMTRSASANLSWDTSHRKLSGTILEKKDNMSRFKKIHIAIQLCLSNYLNIKLLPGHLFLDFNCEMTIPSNS